jgi:hypothetical protein
MVRSQKKFKAKPLFTVVVGATVLVFLVHPSLGLILLLLVHTWSCHSALVGNVSGDFLMFLFFLYIARRWFEFLVNTLGLTFASLETHMANNLHFI